MRAKYYIMINRIPTCRKLEDFKECVRLGQVRDRYGNRLSFYPPSRDTFFSCLSFAQCGTDRMRGVIREGLVTSFVERVTRQQCHDVRKWRKEIDASTLVISERCLDDPAVRSLAVTSGGIADDESLLQDWILSSTTFRRAVLRFVDANMEVGAVYCRYVFAYLYCSVYDSDVVFYALSDDEGDDQDVVIEHEISKIDGKAMSVMHDRTYADPRNRPPPSTPRPEGSSSSSVSDSDLHNWHTTYLLYISGEAYETGRFELMYTPSVGPDGYQQLRRRQRYQLRVCYVDGNRGKVNCEPKMGQPAIFCPPAKGWKVHSYLLAPDELYPERIYQVNSADARGLTPDRLPMNKSMFVYLYYNDVGGQPLAVFVKAIDGGPAPQGPMFSICSQRTGNADGVLVAIASNLQHAHRRVQLETRTQVYE